MRCSGGLFLGAMLCALAAPFGCAGELSGDPDSYRIHVEPGCNVIPVFTQHCATSFCHGGAQPQAGLDLASPDPKVRLVGVASRSSGCQTELLIDPADVNKSFLLEKLESGAPSCGQQMPLTGAVTDPERACVRAWATALVGPSPVHDSGTPIPPKSDASARRDAGKVSTPDAGSLP